MPRTRDMVLFVACAVVLTVCISYTYVNDIKRAAVQPVQNSIEQTSKDALVYTAVAPETAKDRQSTIDRLRTLLQKNNEVISAPDPSVEEVPQDTQETSTKNQPTVVLDSCPSGSVEQQLLGQYPLRFVAITVKNGVRFVMYTPPSIQSSGTSTGAVTTENKPRILLAMPVFPQVLSKPNCVSSDIVGVTASGALLANTDALSYLSAPTDELIGYARDGFPIYGPYEGEVDQCGGYMHPEGYRYTLSKERSFVLGCYVGTPLPFTL